MRFFKLLLVFFILSAVIVSIAPHISFADTQQEEFDKKNQEIKDLEAKIADLKTQSKSLSLQISVMNNQIKLSELRIESTTQLIAKLNSDIGLLTNKVDQLEGRLKEVSEILLNRIVVSYKVGNLDPVQAVFASNGFSDFISRAKYIQVAQEHDRKLLFELEQTKVNYNNQKDILKTKQEEQKAQKVKLEKLNADLAQQKKDKEALLKLTQNNESIYQQKLQTALAEQQAIAKILLGGGNVIAAGDAKEGDVIGFVINGRSACSSGTHLHFEVHKNDVVQNPSDFLKNISVTFDNSPDSSFSFNGSWNWPLLTPIKINQGYGMTYWARTGWYGGGPHTGIDISSTSSQAVRAVKDGKLFRGGIACGGGQLLFARIDHSDGVQSYYLHIVP